LMRNGTVASSPRDASIGFFTSPSASTTSLRSSVNGQMSREGSRDRHLEAPGQGSSSTWPRSANRLRMPLSPSHSTGSFAEEWLPRASFSGSVASTSLSEQESAQMRRHSAQPPYQSDSGPATPSLVGGRQRSSTLSAVTPSPSNQGAVSSLRKRPGATRRLSVGIFGSPGSAGGKSPLFPLPSKTTGDATTAVDRHAAVGTHDTSRGHVSSKPPIRAPPPKAGESAASWLDRLLEVLSPSNVAAVLASRYVKQSSKISEVVKLT
jgi:hypothetical protein